MIAPPDFHPSLCACIFASDIMALLLAHQICFIYAIFANVGPSVVRPVVISQNLSKIDPHTWNTNRQLASPHSDPPGRCSGFK